MLPRSSLVLGIESSCDETAVAIVRADAPLAERILVNLVHSQIEEHAGYGGVVPEVAARAHAERIGFLIKAAISKAAISTQDLDAVAATAGPGLIGALVVGLSAAKGFALGAGKPLIAVHHLEGHLLTPRLTQDTAFPYLALLLSGGHSMFVAVEGLGRYRILGTSIDDALGEAFDKIAKWLGLGYPGGPALEKFAQGGDPRAYSLPHPLKGRQEPNLSFSGLKTAVRLAGENDQPLSEEKARNLAASFQARVVDIVTERCETALGFWRDHYGTEPSTLVVSGGVAANRALRGALSRLAEQRDLPLVLPPLNLCGDNAAMIAWAGAERFASGLMSDLSAAPRARWPLTELAS